MERKLYRFAVLAGMAGLLLTAVVIISKTAYPDMLFQVLVPAALLLIFISFGLFVLNWIFLLKKRIKSKNYLYVVLLVLIGMIIAVRIAAHL